MKNKKNIILLVALVLVITFSTLLFFGIGNNEKSSIEIWSFIFIIMAELIFYCNALILLSKKTNTFLKAGFSSTSFLYLVCTIFINTIFLSIFKTLKNLLITNFCILIAYFLINTIILFFKRED